MIVTLSGHIALIENWAIRVNEWYGDVSIVDVREQKQLRLRSPNAGMAHPTLPFRVLTRHLFASSRSRH
jgi:hypothetical protein